MRETIILSAILILGIGLVIFLLEKRITELKKDKSDNGLFEWLKSMQASLDNNSQTLNSAMRSSGAEMTKVLQENTKQLNDRLTKAAEAMRDVSREVGQMSEIGRNMRELQEFLKSPKIRGNIGEQVLKDLISQMFPKNSFMLQYMFKSGEKVDAAIKTDAGILTIDSKFPMENFQRMVKAETDQEKILNQKEFTKDIKKHIDSIAKKYILPNEGTMDFALMYVPSESVYYELVNMLDIMEYARISRVYIVSPTTLYAHLQTILLSFEGKQIETKSKQIFKMLRTLQIDYEKVQNGMETLGRHINNASSQFHNVSAGFSKIGENLSSAKMIEEKPLLKD